MLDPIECSVMTVPGSDAVDAMSDIDALRQRLQDVEAENRELQMENQRSVSPGYRIDSEGNPQSS
jgi:hypothetical protein